MSASVQTRTQRSTGAAIGVLWLSRGVLVVASLIALRAAAPLFQDAMDRSAAEFTHDALLSGAALASYGLTALGACLFTLACRLPLRPGIAWVPLALAAIPLLLAAHLPLLVTETFTRVSWMNRFYFFDQEPTWWTLIALVGVAIGCALGRPAPPEDPPVRAS